MKKILVTGGAGFIGSHLVEQLINDGHKVIVLDNYSTGRIDNLSNINNAKQLKIYECDIRSYNTIEKYFENIDWVFHLAALADVVPSVENPYDYYSTNVNGTFNVLEASKKYNIKKLVYSASSSCYGIAKEFPTHEDSLIDPQYPYALTKYLGEELVLHWCKVFKLPSVSLRFFNVYGLRSRTSGTYGAVFGVFLAQKIHNKPFTVVGNGEQTRDFTFVTDIVSALIKAAGSDITGEIINIGSDNTYSINTLVKLLKGKVKYIPKRPGEPDCTWANIDRAKKLLNWKPKITLEEGVNILLENIDYWSNAPVWEEESIAKATKKWFEYLG